MGLRLQDDSRPGIPVGEMKDGQIARIVAWSSGPLGRLVQRYNDTLVLIGETSGKAYTAIFKSRDIHGACRVEIIPNGNYRWEVFDNE